MVRVVRVVRVVRERFIPRFQQRGKKKYLSREQDAPTVFKSKYCRIMHDHYNAPPPPTQYNMAKSHPNISST
ncbi:MAG: hypothetical protein F6K22_02995 [Okeania sp. SIO2F4]|uniref:hypothetical protein n=1 Tax=Okeania sp. SIO2F4 TaxID=2607790 RepID=UPI001428E529|nr:hypothetical protein [Okeania sp. SIO2F4]NES01883.1 hypothetical protein [Okeania sp. SIO2F4]